MTSSSRSLSEVEVHGHELLPFQRQGWTSDTQKPLKYNAQITDEGVSVHVEGDRALGFIVCAINQQTWYEALCAFLNDNRRATQKKSEEQSEAA